ncbi:MAG: alcohol dehydrogenase catalytic domain-containing protein [Streptosporangiaceae bacterium]
MATPTSSPRTPDRRTMRAAIFAGPEDARLTSRPLARVTDPSEVVVAPEACGICGTDLHILEDPPGHPATPGVILGHEIVGNVTECGAGVYGVGAGDRVVVQPNLACGSCLPCKRGLRNHCENFTSLGIFRDGGLADAVAVPARACHRVSDALPRRIAALAEPLSCVLNGLSQARPEPGEVAVIFGAGAIGLIFEALLRAAGARCVVVEPDETRRAAASRMGACHTVDPRAGRVSEIVHRVTGGLGADVIIDAVGSQLPAAIEVARPRARVLLFGMNAGARDTVRQFDVTRGELQVFGTYVGDHTFPDAVRILEQGIVDLDPIVSHELPLERLPDGIAAARSGEAVKVVIDLTT